jgi:hypothetical protein
MPRCGVPVRQDGTNVVNAPFFRRLTCRDGREHGGRLRPATGTAQRAIPTLMVCERHNPIFAAVFNCAKAGEMGN